MRFPAPVSAAEMTDSQARRIPKRSPSGQFRARACPARPAAPGAPGRSRRTRPAGTRSVIHPLAPRHARHHHSVNPPETCQHKDLTDLPPPQLNPNRTIHTFRPHRLLRPRVVSAVVVCDRSGALDHERAAASAAAFR
ncbi:hypothetical protein GCM10010532_089680 [Dactylosporangium siamense]|uniref:Uncharacterized protein n=1 Tax=Dactylosporangium siamense TaxID=685454 RepID=A0A919UBN8_9ACTN|nr:hypothetical protein Dsi01nite_077300 [Dactylosporangium siamense]